MQTSYSGWQKTWDFLLKTLRWDGNRAGRVSVATFLQS